MGKNLLNLKEVNISRDVGHHIEERRAQIIEDEKDRVKIRKFLSTCIHPFDTENYPTKIVNIHTVKLSNKDVDKCIEIGSEQVTEFHQTLLEGFYNPLSKQVKTMPILQKSAPVIDEEITDTSLIYSRVVAMELTNAAMAVKNVLMYELACLPNSIFNDEGDLRLSKVKGRPEKDSKIRGVKSHNEQWVVKSAMGSKLANKGISHQLSLKLYILQKLATGNINLPFDRYYDYSIKSSTRSGCGRSTCRTHKLTPISPLPSKITTLGSSANKSQLIELICDHLLSICCSHQMQYSLIATDY